MHRLPMPMLRATRFEPLTKKGPSHDNEGPFDLRFFSFKYA